MRSILTVISDEALLNRIKAIFNDESVEYYYADTGDGVADIASEHEIAVAVVEFSQPVISGEEICEMLLAINPQMQIVLIFDENDTSEVISVYNRLHVNKLICKQIPVLKELPSMVEMCFQVYNRGEIIEDLDEDLKLLNDKYMKPMQEMSSLLNERLSGYNSIINVFKRCIVFISYSSEKALKTVNSFVDRILNDYIQIYMIKEPDVDFYFSRIKDNFNKPEEKKFFKFINEDIDIASLHGETKYNLLFILDIITMGFDTFYPFYRGKISVEEIDDKIEVNAIYEVRKEPDNEIIYNHVIAALCNLLSTYSYESRFGEKNSLMQFKSTLLKRD